jgi:endonuclease VIII
MPEGDSLRQAADRVRVLEGEVVRVEAPHPRAAALGIAPRLDGRRLERVEAVGKNLLLTFAGGLVLRSHLRMRGRWHVRRVGFPRSGTPWLVISGLEHEAILWNGPVLELGRKAVDRLGPDIMAEPPQYDAIVTRLRVSDPGREIGDALVDQRLVAGIGNVWRAEALFEAGVSPWTRLGDLDDEALAGVVRAASEAMRGGRRERAVYRRGGRPCRRCGTPISVRRQGETARAVYWCARCQPVPRAGTAPSSA